MTPEYLEKLIRDVAPLLRTQLLSAFYGTVYHDALSPAADNNVIRKLDGAVLAKDRAAIFAMLGISEDGSTWPRLDDGLQFVFNNELLPVYDHVRWDSFRALAENPDDFERDKSDYLAALDKARSTIVAETLAGTLAAIAMIFGAPVRYGFNAAHLIASIGMTAKQVQFYLAGVRKAAKVQAEIEKNADDIEKQVVTLQTELKGVPARIANAIRTIIREGRSLANFSLDDTRRFNKKLSKAMQENRASALSRLLIVTAANTTELSVWKQAQRLDIVGSDAVKLWQTAGDEKVRHTHAETEALNAGGVALDQPFKTPLGISVQGPPLEVNCRCSMVLGSRETKSIIGSPSRFSAN